jgi:hypothetical protein
MTFMTSHSGIVYQKDLGKDTEAAATALQSFDPAGWAEVSEEDLKVIPELDET